MCETTGKKIGLIPPGVKAFGINIFEEYVKHSSFEELISEKL